MSKRLVKLRGTEKFRRVENRKKAGATAGGGTGVQWASCQQSISGAGFTSTQATNIEGRWETPYGFDNPQLLFFTGLFMVGQMAIQTVQYASFVFVSYGQAIATLGEGIGQSIKAVKEGIFGASEQIESPMFTTPCSEKKNTGAF